MEVEATPNRYERLSLDSETFVPKTPKHPIDKAYIRNDGNGALSLLIGLSHLKEPGSTQSFVALGMRAGTSMDEAAELARAINDRLVSVSLLEW
ncbi:MAG: hypothetical protein K2P70_09050 [Hyphomonadaceae bacterium]|nr:hypothetical protein [Hyphomonadaceae bacterium]